MKKRNVPFCSGTPSDNKSLHPFSNNRVLREAEAFNLRLAVLTEFNPVEPKSVTQARSRIEIAECVNEYLLNAGLPPIFDSFEYEGLRMKKVS